MNPTFTNSNRTDSTYSEKPMYHFEQSFDEDFTPILEAVKSWSGGEQKLRLGTYNSISAVHQDMHDLVELRGTEGLEASMQLAEYLAVSEGSLDYARPDGRMFTDGPPDPFVTDREQELASLNYTYDIVPHSGGTFELQSQKTWEMDGKPKIESIALGEYDTISDANREQGILLSIRAVDGLETEMNIVEKIAIENGSLAANREDPRLFRQGPADPFKTRIQRELALEPTVQPVAMQPEPELQQEPQPIIAVSIDMDM
ncbi:MAG: hypothetical protein H6670_11070 [Anaerolineaceae bacterium]|nr:hypothetical protein [Anaerolineaceae bacterium]